MNFPKFSELIRTIERSLATLFGSWLITASSALDYLLATIAALLIGMPFLTQAAFFVDSATGSDTNTGATANTALKTLGELSRRLSGKVLTSSTTITLSGAFGNESLTTNCSLDSSKTFIVNGTPVTVAQGTITTYTARNAAGNASATILADIDFAALVGKRVRLTSGAHAGAIGWVLADLGGNTCRVGGFTVIGAFGVTESQPTNGATFVVEDCTLVGGVGLAVWGGALVRVLGVESQVQAQFLEQYIVPADNTFVGGFFYCKFSGANLANFVFGGNFGGCAFTTNGFFTGTVSWNCVNVINASQAVTGAYLGIFGVYSSFDGAASRLSLSGTVLQEGVDVQFFGVSGTAIVGMSDGTTWGQLTGNFIYGGTNTATNAFLVRSGSALLYFSNKPSIVGNNPGVNDIKLGGTDLGWAAIPTINIANNAMAVVRA